MLIKNGLEVRVGDNEGKIQKDYKGKLTCYELRPRALYSVPSTQYLALRTTASSLPDEGVSQFAGLRARSLAPAGENAGLRDDNY